MPLLLNQSLLRMIVDIKQTSLQDAFIIEPEPFKDDRGLFARVFCQHELQNVLHGKNIVQINHSLTKQKGAIRGMHFQYPPKAETKMVKCLGGSLEKDCEVLYLHTEFYDPEHEGGVRYNDPKINISWPLEVTDISEKDRKYSLLGEDFEGIVLARSS